MSTEPKAHPAATLRLGALKCTIWPNAASNERTYYSAQIVRSYRLPTGKREQDDDGWRETSSMQEEDLIVMQELVRRAANWIRRQIETPAEATASTTASS